MANPRNLGWHMLGNGRHFYKVTSTQVRIITRAVMLALLRNMKSGALTATVKNLMNDKKKSPSRSAIGPYSPRSFYGKTKKIIYGPGVNRQSVNQYLPSIMNATNNAPIRTRNSPPKRYEPTPRRRRNNNNNNAPAPSARRIRV
jgi:hypothetical protein